MVSYGIVGTGLGFRGLENAARSTSLLSVPLSYGIALHPHSFTLLLLSLPCLGSGIHIEMEGGHRTILGTKTQKLTYLWIPSPPLCGWIILSSVPLLTKSYCLICEMEIVPNLPCSILWLCEVFVCKWEWISFLVTKFPKDLYKVKFQFIILQWKKKTINQRGCWFPLDNT